MISRETIAYHHGKHHAGYASKLNDLVKGTKLASMPLEEIVRFARTEEALLAVYQNAAQVWNHDVYWQSLRAPSDAKPAGRLAKAIDASFGSHAAFRDAFTKAAVGQFGSGWAWLVAEGEKLSVVATSDADGPLTMEGDLVVEQDAFVPDPPRALLVVDVWEHAYYIDHRNRRQAYVEAVFDRLLDWEFAASRLG